VPGTEVQVLLYKELNKPTVTEKKVFRRKPFTCFNCYQPGHKAVNCSEQNSLKQQNQKYKEFNIRSDQEYKVPSTIYQKTYPNKTAVFNISKIEEKRTQNIRRTSIIMSDGTASFSV
jgi:hypothetical protein